MAVLRTSLVLFLALCCPGSVFGSANRCDEVRKVFQLRQIGPNQLLPLSPRPGADLQVCASRNLSCCTKKMEERYQVAARRDVQSLLQTSSSGLKLLISRNVAAFQDTFELLLQQAENHTHWALRQSFGPGLAAQAQGPVRELFTDAGLFLLGSELNVDEVVLRRFFDALFPAVYGTLVDPVRHLDLAPGYAECVRASGRDVRPFGAAPALLADQIARSGLSGKLLLQALHLGIEVLNTTDHLPLSRECRRALLKMNYCPHCQGLTKSQPCMGYCLNVMRGCLASMAEIDPHWREFVGSLEGLSARMLGPQDLEQVLLGVHTLIHDAVAHAQRNAARLSAQVHRLCGPPSRRPAQSVSLQDQSLPLKALGRPPGDPLASRRRDFLGSLRLYRTYYGGLADQLCVSELASGDGPSCWNGTDIVKSYTLRVVGNGIKAQSANPEVRVKGADPAINQIIDKLKHINQLLQGKSIPRLGSLDQIETGSGDSEGRYSGDCDDEDGCAGSGAGEGRAKGPRVSKLTPDASGDHRHHHHRHHHPPPPPPPAADGSEASEGRSGGGPGLGLTGSMGLFLLLLPCLVHLLLAP